MRDLRGRLKRLEAEAAAAGAVVPADAQAQAQRLVLAALTDPELDRLIEICESEGNRMEYEHLLAHQHEEAAVPVERFSEPARTEYLAIWQAATERARANQS